MKIDAGVTASALLAALVDGGVGLSISLHTCTMINRLVRRHKELEIKSQKVVHLTKDQDFLSATAREKVGGLDPQIAAVRTCGAPWTADIATDAPIQRVRCTA